MACCFLYQKEIFNTKQDFWILWHDKYYAAQLLFFEDDKIDIVGDNNEIIMMTMHNSDYDGADDDDDDIKMILATHQGGHRVGQVW